MKNKQKRIASRFGAPNHLTSRAVISAILLAASFASPGSMPVPGGTRSRRSDARGQHRILSANSSGSVHWMDGHQPDALSIRSKLSILVVTKTSLALNGRSKPMSIVVGLTGN